MTALVPHTVWGMLSQLILVLGRRAIALEIMGAKRGAAGPRVSIRRRVGDMVAAPRGTAHRKWGATGDSRSTGAVLRGTARKRAAATGVSRSMGVALGDTLVKADMASAPKGTALKRLAAAAMAADPSRW